MEMFRAKQVDLNENCLLVKQHPLFVLFSHKTISKNKQDCSYQGEALNAPTTF